MPEADKIQLVAVNDTDSGKKISYASFLREDYVAKSMVIYVGSDKIIEKILFSSDVHGTVDWENGTGLTECHRWESEDQAQSQSYLTRHYTTILSDGAVDADYARSTIIPDILDNLNDAGLAEWVGDIVQVKEYLVPVDLAQFRSER